MPLNLNCHHISLPSQTLPCSQESILSAEKVFDVFRGQPERPPFNSFSAGLPQVRTAPLARPQAETCTPDAALGLIALRRLNTQRDTVPHRSPGRPKCSRTLSGR